MRKELDKLKANKSANELQTPPPKLKAPTPKSSASKATQPKQKAKQAEAKDSNKKAKQPKQTSEHSDDNDDGDDDNSADEEELFGSLFDCDDDDGTAHGSGESDDDSANGEEPNKDASEEEEEDAEDEEQDGKKRKKAQPKGKAKAKAKVSRGGRIEKQDDDKMSEAAQEARLRRLCQKRAHGRCHVPDAIHEQWKAGGAGRDELLEMLRTSGFDKDSCFCVVFIMFL